MWLKILKVQHIFTEKKCQFLTIFKSQTLNFNFTQNRFEPHCFQLYIIIKRRQKYRF